MFCSCIVLNRKGILVSHVDRLLMGCTVPECVLGRTACGCVVFLLLSPPTLSLSLSLSLSVPPLFFPRMSSAGQHLRIISLHDGVFREVRGAERGRSDSSAARYWGTLFLGFVWLFCVWFSVLGFDILVS